MMAKKFADLRAKMSPESRSRAESKAKIMLAEEMVGAVGGYHPLSGGRREDTNFAELDRCDPPDLA